ncbi:MAG: FAD-dependent oxidoreductase [Bacteroidetes bacterium]|nr:FAD-dependent oxidoreductase [Bacteroidota bacterium]
MNKYKYVIIGGGTTAGYAAQEFVDQGINKRELCIISAESILPMNRPPLSKEYLKDAHKDEELLVNDNSFYVSNGIDLLLESRVKSVDFGSNQVLLDSGEQISYEKLLIATGSKLKRLDVDGGNLENIFYLRRIEHADKIREQAKKSKNAVVVGGGYIGSETAAILSGLGLEVTMIIPEEQLLAGFASEEIGNYFKKVYNDHGVKMIFNDEAVGFNGNAGVKEVELASGKRIAADMVVAGIGVEPNLDIFKGTALKMDKGILVNEYCETNIDNVYAAGDVAEFPDQIFNKTRHVEHWENAFEQGKHAALVMSGKQEPYIFMPFFFSDIFNLSYEYFGDQSNADDSLVRGDISSGDFSYWWFKDNRVLAAFIMSTRPEEEGEKAREWISYKTNIDKEKLADKNVEMTKMELNPKYWKGQ